MNKIPACSHLEHGHRVADPSSRSRAEQEVEVCMHAGLLVATLLSVQRGLVSVASISREPAGSHHRHHEALQLAVTKVANQLAATPALPVNAASVFSPSWQLQ